MEPHARVGVGAAALAFASLALATGACDQQSPEERGAAIFSDPRAAGFAPGSMAPYSCAFCHDVNEPSADGVVRPGFPMTNAGTRPSFWGGQARTLRDAANLCVTSFMLSDTPFQPDDPDWLALRRYIESLSDGPSAAPLTLTLPHECSSCGSPDGCDNCAPDLTSGDPDNGAAVYGRTCALCHGTFGGGDGRRVAKAVLIARGAGGGLQLEGTAESDPDNNRHHVAGKVRFGPFGPYGAVPGTAATAGDVVFAPPARVAPPPGTLFHLAYPSMPPFVKERLSADDLRDLLAFFYGTGPTP